MRGRITAAAILAPLAMAVGVIASMSYRSILLAVAAVMAIVVRARTAALMLVVVVPILGLIRRLVSPGRVDNDPLLLVPVALLALAVVKSMNRAGDEQERARPGALLQLVLVGLVILPLVGADRNVAALYTAGLFASCFAAMLFIRQGLFPDVRDTLVRFAPITTLALSLYGLFQFLVLPSWDRAWMLAAQLTSIGAPFPHQVRVFGTAESPGPFAMILGGLVLIVLHAMWFRPGQRKAISWAALTAAAPALILTGVRTSLVGLALVFFLAALKTRRLGLIVAVAAVALGLWKFGQVVLGASSSSLSNVFVANRYTVSGLGQDYSIQERLGLLDQVGAGLRSGLGTGWDGSRVDNLYIDTLLSGGAVVGVLCLLVAAIVGIRAVLADWRLPDGAFYLVTIYTLVFSLGSAILTTTSGLLVALVWGWTLLPRPRVAVEPTRPPATAVLASQRS